MQAFKSSLFDETFFKKSFFKSIEGWAFSRIQVFVFHWGRLASENKIVCWLLGRCTAAMEHYLMELISGVKRGAPHTVSVPRVPYLVPCTTYIITSHLIPHTLYYIPHTHVRHADRGTNKKKICELLDKRYKQCRVYPAPDTPPCRGGLYQPGCCTV